MSTSLQKLFFTISIVDKATESINKIQRHVDKFKQTATFSFATFQTLRGLLQPAIQFQSVLSDIGVAGAGSQENLNRMADSARSMTLALGSNAVQNLTMLQDTRRLSGLAGGELETMASATTVLVRRFKDLNQREVIVAQTELMRTFGVSALEAADAVSNLAMVGGDLKGELMPAIHEYAHDFADQGYSFNQTISALRAGLGTWNLDRVGDLFKEGSISMRELGVEQLQSFRNLGLIDLVPQIQAGTIDQATVAKEVGKALSGIENVTERFNIIQALFKAPGEDIGVQSTMRVLQAIGESSEVKGSFKEIMEGYNNSFAGQSMALFEVIRMMQEQTGSVFVGFLAKLIYMFNSLVSPIARFAQEYKNIAGAIGSVIGGLFLFVAAASLAKTAFLGLKIAWALGKSVLGGLVGMIKLKLLWTKLVMAAEGAYSAIASKAAIATKIFSISLLGIPLLWVVAAIAAVVGAVVGIIYYWDELTAMTVSLGSVLKGYFLQALEWVKNGWKWLTETMQSVIVKMGGLGQVIKYLLAIIFSFVVIPLLIAENWDTLKQIFSQSIQAMLEKLGALWEIIQRIAAPVLGKLGIEVEDPEGIDAPGVTGRVHYDSELTNLGAPRKRLVVPGAENGAVARMIQQNHSSDNRQSVQHTNHFHVDGKMDISTFDRMLALKANG